MRLAWKLPQTLAGATCTEVLERRLYVGVESHDVKAVLPQFRKTPCVTVQVKVTTTSHGHTAVLPSCSTLGEYQCAEARKVVYVCVGWIWGAP